MKLWIVVAMLAAQLARLRAVRRHPEQGPEGSGAEAEVRRPEHHRGGRDQDRRRRQPEDPPAVRRRPGSGGPQVRRRWSARLVALQTERPKLPWTFIVLDTDGVNAFASPGGFVHITRGALGADQERSGARRRARPRDDARRAQAHRQRDPEGQGGARSAPARRCPTAARSSTSSRTRPTRWCSRTRSIAATSSTPTPVRSRSSQKLGYAPASLADFLTRLDERNKDQAEQNGLFASHPGDEGADRQGPASRRLRRPAPWSPHATRRPSSISRPRSRRLRSSPKARPA